MQCASRCSRPAEAQKRGMAAPLILWAPADGSKLDMCSSHNPEVFAWWMGTLRCREIKYQGTPAGDWSAG